ncbi:protein AGENET DOMAIN (AGD)-CONTAINING P1 isoform X1 [Cannabis sativa]|uniref:protein AGENET DOMAIN (AGD)-CONTAINING P1 isoform X1 n=1 Tax=Cannabis sativa TaxID=3483 RepID=UPI0029CA1362|nr:protein AGENET DOMAIN (AGD)-CONTAINING P1 isoform X1 [Cannabis sativa]
MAPSFSIKLGDLIEVYKPCHASNGPYFPATVIRSPVNINIDNVILYVEYGTHTPNAQEIHPTPPSREVVSSVNVRPVPPLFSFEQVVFKVGDDVDFFFRNRWSRGVVESIFEEKARYIVTFHDSARKIVCPLYNLRVHREWNNGAWNPPLPPSQRSSEVRERCIKSKTPIHKFPLKVKEKSMKVKGTPIYKNSLERSKLQIVKEEIFKNGAVVEVSSDEKGYEGSWFKAKIIESLADDNFWVEYKDLVTEDEVPQPLREKAERRHIRPEPPLAPPEYQFKFSEKVDAWYNDGWWEGEISKVLPFSSYNVYFKHTREEITFSYSHLRPHRDWIKGKWCIPPASHTIHTQKQVYSSATLMQRSLNPTFFSLAPMSVGQRL